MMHVMRYALFTSALFISAAMAVPHPSQAQARPEVPVELEGPIQWLRADNGGVRLKVGGVEVAVPAGLIAGNGVRTPTAKLNTAEAILDTAPFPGRPDHQGFVGGTAIVVGTSSEGGVTARDVFLQPAESVVIGAVTANSENDFRVEGMKVYLLPPAAGASSYPMGAGYDARLPGLPMKNNLGLTVDPAKVQLYAQAAAEGYIGKDVTGEDAFYAFSIGTVSEVVGSSPTVTIQRAQCRVRSATEIEWEVRGGIFPWVAGATVAVHPPSALYNGGQPYAATLAVERDTSDPNTGSFRYSTRRASAGGCPPSVIVKYGTAPDAVATVEIR
jgi:hypothetical protein